MMSAAAASDELLALALGALAVVVELGGLAQQPIVVVVALALELVGAANRPLPPRRAGGFRGVSAVDVGRVDCLPSVLVLSQRYERALTIRLMAFDRLSTTLMARE